jgi:hypothetical protein
MAIETNPTIGQVLEHAKTVAKAQTQLRKAMAAVSAEVAASAPGEPAPAPPR